MNPSGNWQIVVKAGGNATKATLQIESDGATFSAQLRSATGDADFAGGSVESGRYSAKGKVDGVMPMKVDLAFEQPADDALVGTIKLGLMGTADFTATRA